MLIHHCCILCETVQTCSNSMAVQKTGRQSEAGMRFQLTCGCFISCQIILQIHSQRTITHRKPGMHRCIFLDLIVGLPCPLLLPPCGVSSPRPRFLFSKLGGHSASASVRLLAGACCFGFAIFFFTAAGCSLVITSRHLSLSKHKSVMTLVAQVVEVECSFLRVLYNTQICSRT